MSIESKNQKPAAKTVKAEIKTCTACGKKMTIVIGKDHKSYQCASDCLIAFGIEKIPNSGWHWWTDVKTGERKRMYPICEKCWTKLEDIRKARKKTVKGKISTKSK